MNGPYGRAARRYYAAGWESPLPLPPRKKKEPPAGYTGRTAPMASRADVEAWCEDRPRSNIALRLPPTVVGIDADPHKSPEAARAWAELVERFGPLPAAAPWSTARDDGVSGIRFFAIPDGYAAVTVLGDAGEVIQHHHRYAVVWPSVHPDTGNTYQWVNAPDGQIPDARKLPPLPAAWLEGLRAGQPGEPGSNGQTGWTDPDIDTLAEHGIPAAVPRHDDVLRDVVWKMRADGTRRATERAVWLTITGKTPLKDPARPWTGEDFDRHWLGACRKISPGEDGLEPDRLEFLRSRLLDRAALAAIPPAVPLIDGLLYANTLAWLTGKHGSAKSLIALDWAGCVGRGLPWDGRPVRQGPVLYVVAEDDSGQHQRVTAWEDHHGPVEGVTWLTEPVRLPADADRVSQLAAGLGAVLVIIDTQAQVTTGLDENSSKDMGRLADALHTIRRATGACVLLLHHEPRNGDHPRGHSTIDGAASTMLRAVKDGTLVKLTNTKQRNAVESPPVQLVLIPHLTSALVGPITPVGLGNVQTDSVDTLRDTLLALVGLKGGASYTELKADCGLPVSTFKYALNALVNRGEVRNAGSKARTFYVIIPEGERANEGQLG
jgi:hypothetical protein